MKTKMAKVGFYRFGGFKFFIYKFPNQKENHTKGLFKEESMIKKSNNTHHGHDFAHRPHTTELSMKALLLPG